MTDQRERTPSDLMRGQAAWLTRTGRSPLYAQLMSSAADDYDAGGVTAALFAGTDVSLASFPQLRLMAALHELALTGREPELAAFYPSAGGDRSPEHAWTFARAAIEQNVGWIEARIDRTVQTNEPGRSAVLYAVLLWLTAGHGLPIRLLEIGASAGLNLAADRYRYEVGPLVLGDPDSPLGFEQPWEPAPPIDLAAASRELRISHREGCDPHPLDPSNPDDRRRLISYIWPDEGGRLQRLRAALEVNAPQPPMVVKAAAAEWLPEALRRRRDGELTVVWHSIMRQYVDPGEWAVLEARFGDAVAADPHRPVVFVGMEPETGRVGDPRVTLRTGPDDAGELVATCDDHGPPVVWGTV